MAKWQERILSFLMRQWSGRNTLEIEPNNECSTDHFSEAAFSPIIEKSNRERRIERMRQYNEEKARQGNNGGEKKSRATPNSGPPTLLSVPRRSELTIDDLLPIYGLVPKGSDPKCVQAVIYWGFVRPAREVPLFNGYYAPREGIVGSVVGKGYSLEQVTLVIKTLEHQGLVLSHRHGTQEKLSFNTKPNGTMSPSAQKIARICSSANYRLRRRALGLE